MAALVGGLVTGGITISDMNNIEECGSGRKQVLNKMF
jgi:hypothetical protein